MHGDVGKGAHKASAEMTVEGFHPPDGFGRLDKAIQRCGHVVTVFDDPDKWLRQEICKMRGDTHGTNTWSAAAMWDREGLVQIEVH